ncbi:SymE family type I addiction module toxin [Flavobacterium ginsengiterrae]|uniref:Toxin SymE-like domain-containing protein n=1 Tax=Flavobacterium ginsengiterrae TaxID=871695 RepID=A0ABP7GX35_9FLAO
MTTIRKLKIHSKYQKRTYKDITIPEIRLEGKWLEKLGFKQNHTIIVEEMKNKLIITVENN